MSTEIADELIKARRRLDLTQAKLQQLSGVDRRRLSQFETGKRVPTPEEVARLVAAGILERRRSSPERVRRNYTSSWVERLPSPNRAATRPLGVRVAAARARFGVDLECSLFRLGEGDERSRAIDFLAHSCLDSGSELFFWASLLSDGAVPIWTAPSRVGFRALPIVDSETREVLSDTRFPSLEHELGGLRVIAFPQIHVQARASLLRLDALMGVALGGRKVWVNVEIDGSGHDPRFDTERQRALALPTVRLNDDELSRAALATLTTKLTLAVRA